MNGPVVSPFGPRWGRLHAGVDIAVGSGTPIRAADSGSVVLMGWVGGYGNYTCIQHTGSLSSCYAHQSSFATSNGAGVKQGQVIGYVGCTGHCFGDHLHFETRINGSPWTRWATSRAARGPAGGGRSCRWRRRPAPRTRGRVSRAGGC